MNKKKKGFTIFEAVIALSISGIVLASTTSVLTQVSQKLNDLNEQVIEDSKSRNLVNNFYIEVRSTTAIHSTIPNSFGFTYIDTSGSTKEIYYTWDADLKTLSKKNVTDDKSEQVNIKFSEVKFKYYDKYGDEVVTANISNVNVNAVQAYFKQIVLDKEIEIESPVIMFRNKSLI